MTRLSLGASADDTAAMAFSGNPLDRCAARRGDAAWLAQIRGAASTRIMLLCKSQPVMAGRHDSAAAELAFVDGKTASTLGTADATEVFLGLDGAIAYFARDISAAGELPAALGHVRDARAAIAVLSANQVAMLGQAKALLEWHWRHPYCSRCGAPSVPADGGYKRICSRCGTERFPRTDPAVIMLVVAGDACLLARNKRFIGGHYSTLAGFVEAGETIEEAVAREVYEEVGVKTGQVRYFASQPWPFPHSLMIGCFAEALSHEIVVDGEEIVTARWVDRATVRRIVAGESSEIAVPRRDAIAFHLIKAWAEG